MADLILQLQGLGFACQPVRKWELELMHQIQMRLSPRVGDKVYQSVTRARAMYFLDFLS